MEKHYDKYIITFFITATIFLSAFYISEKILNSKIQQLRLLHEKISLNILSTETRLSFLKQVSCSAVKPASAQELGITDELNRMAKRIKLLESELSEDDENLEILRRKYVLLQVKDYLLVQELAKKCKYNIATVLYFYTNSCKECKEQSIVLDEIKDRYRYVRVYWIDETLPDPTVRTLLKLFKIKEFPALVVGSDVYQGYVDYEKLSSIIERWAKIHNALKDDADQEVILKIFEQLEKEGVKEVDFVKYENGKYYFKADKIEAVFTVKDGKLKRLK